MQWFDAARKGDVAELQRHLQSGQDVNAKGAKGLTALIMAAAKGRTEAVRLLLAHGADANVHAKGTGRPFTVAVEGHHWATADALLDGGANPNHGGVAIYVIGEKQVDLLKKMLARGLDPSGKGEVGSYLKHAVDEAYQEAFSEPDGRHGYRRVDRGDLRSVEALLEAGGDVRKAEEMDGESILFSAVVAADAPAIRRLVKAGADINRPIDKHDRKTLLMWLARNEGSEAMIRLLVSLGADVNATDKDRETALDYAEQEKAKANAKLLRELGATKGKAKKAAAGGDDDDDEDDDDNGDPLLKQPLATRRGTLKAWDYDSWEGVAMYVGGPGGVDAVVKSLSKAKRVGAVEDVTRAALAGRLDRPDAPHLIFVKLTGHDWAPVSASFSDSFDTDAWRDLSRDANTRVIWCGHQDTAGATAFEMFDRGESRIEFESCGEEYGAESEDDLDDVEMPSRFESKSHKKNWWQQHENEDETLQALVREQGAYVPIFGFQAQEKTGKLSLYAYPEDTLEPANVERVVMAVYGPADKTKPSPTAKQLLEAINAGDVAAVEAAVAAGADLNFLPGMSDNALSHAVSRALDDPAKGVPVVEALIRAGANVNDGGAGQNAPLWHAFDMCFADLHKKLPVLQALIRAGADLNVRAVTSYPKGRTPLHVAAGSGDMEMVEFLLANGADPSATDAKGKTARQDAQATVRGMLKMIDDEDGQHTGPIKRVVKYLERVEKGEVKPAAGAAAEKDWEQVAAADKAAAEARAAKLKQSFADLGEMFKQLGAVEQAVDRGDEPAARQAAARIATLAQPKTIEVKRKRIAESAWQLVDKRDAAIAALEARGFKQIGTFAVPQFPDLRMVALLHAKQHVYAAVSEMMGAAWVDVVQYYTDGTSLNATNAKSAPEAQAEAPGQRKHRQPRWDAAKLADWTLRQPPPAGAAVERVTAKEFPQRFERDYEREMSVRTSG